MHNLMVLALFWQCVQKDVLNETFPLCFGDLSWTTLRTNTNLCNNCRLFDHKLFFVSWKQSSFKIKSNFCPGISCDILTRNHIAQTQATWPHVESINPFVVWIFFTFYIWWNIFQKVIHPEKNNALELETFVVFTFQRNRFFFLHRGRRSRCISLV